MSLYLTIFDGETELDGLLVGHYSDFGYFRDQIAAYLDATRFPIFMSHSDCDGEWAAEELEALRRELADLKQVLEKLPRHEPVRAFEHVAKARTNAASFAESFHTVDGEPLLDALLRLCDMGLQVRRPILFQ